MAAYLSDDTLAGSSSCIVFSASYDSRQTGAGGNSIASNISVLPHQCSFDIPYRSLLLSLSSTSPLWADNTNTINQFSW